MPVPSEERADIIWKSGPRGGEGESAKVEREVGKEVKDNHVLLNRPLLQHELHRDPACLACGTGASGRRQRRNLAQSASEHREPLPCF